MNTGSHHAPQRARLLSTTLPRAALAAAQARRICEHALRDWSLPSRLIEDVLLACSELVTNAVEHGAGEIRMELSDVGDAIRLLVGDEGAGIPQARPLSMHTVRGRGLAIVAAVSTSWGWLPERTGKSVWATFGTGRQPANG